MRCSSCKFENEPAAQFCEECGSKLVLTCPGCGREARPTAKFCPSCGLALPGQPPAPAKSRKRRGVARPKQAARPAASPAAAKSRPATPEAERRQLTVMFCDLVGSTQLSAQLDPEDYRAVVQQYQQTCMAVIQRHDGYLAQYLGDGMLVYFGFPAAHEDDARRAVRTGLEIVEAIREQTRQHALPVRIGIHTGLVVVGDIGAGSRTEQLALGETPNIAARLQGVAEPNTVIVSTATQRLIDGHFECQPFGSHLVKGIVAPIAVYHVQSERPDASPLAGRTMLTPLVGREQEVGLLVERWEQAKEGRGQVVLLSGEPGIGKSRLAYTLREHVTAEGFLLFEARCSLYHQHSAFYPLTDVLQRTLLFTPQDTDDEMIAKLERMLALYNLQESLPLFTALLSLPTLSQYPPLTLTPQKQKERTLQALVQLLVAQAERQARVSVWEDLHWADPSSLEFLSLLIDQIPTSKLLLVLTFRPEFTPPWKPRSLLSQLRLTRLGTQQVAAMIAKVGAGKALAPEVIEQIGSKTDGVPLFVEELTKSVLESLESPHHIPFHLAVPATLQEALLARLDRLSEARQVAQLGATLGREFSYELLHAVSPLSEADLQAALSKLVEAEILYHRGIGKHARYFFKHALIQDTAYHSLLKSKRQQYHKQIAITLEEQFPQTVETQPEFVAHHYTEAGVNEQAITYWQKAGERASQRSAYVEAISHLTTELELLKPLADTPGRVQQELTLQLALSNALLPVRGYAAPDLEKAVTRARELCQQLGETPQLFPVLFRLWVFYFMRRELQTARELAEQLMRLAQSVQDRYLLSLAHAALGMILHWLGELPLARPHLEQAIALYDPQQHPRFTIGTADHRVDCLSHAAWTLWRLGYLDQALKRSQEALTLAAELAHPYSLALTLGFTAVVHLLRGEGLLAQERAEAVMTLSAEQGFPTWLAEGTMVRGGALAEQGQVKEGLAQMQQGLAALRAMGTEPERLGFLSPLLAAAYAKVEQVEEGLTVLAEALAFVDKTGMRVGEAELYRLKGELMLQKESKVQGPESKSADLRPLTLDPRGAAEACFLKAIDVARKQLAKSLELRAVTSLARLCQHQGKHEEAHRMLSEVYHWFTEGFDTKDLQEAKVLLQELSCNKECR